MSVTTIISKSKFRLVGHSICMGDKDWPPMLRDNSCAQENLAWIVEAMNEKYERERAKQEPK